MTMYVEGRSTLLLELARKAGFTVGGSPDYSLTERDCMLLLETSYRNEKRYSALCQSKVWVMRGDERCRAAACEELLASEGLYVKDEAALKREPGRHWRFFAVPVFHLHAAAVTRTDQLRGLPADWNGRHPLFRRLISAAVRAVYASGQDCAIVRLAADDNGAIRVISIRLEPDEHAWLSAGELLRDFACRAEEEGPVLIGADPEFILLKPNGKLASADLYFDPGQAAGADSLRSRGKLVYPIAELRPRPAGNAPSLSGNIRRLLAEASQAVKGRNLKLLAGAMPLPGVALGGHIHLSGVSLGSRLLRMLDSVVAIPLAAIEGEAGLARRRRFGRLGDFRMQPHGGFEYRTPPSWLASPKAATAAFALAQLAAANWRELPMARLCVLREECRRAYYAADYEVLRTEALRMKEALTQLTAYSKLSDWIDPLFHAVDERKTWNEQADIREKWRIPF